jgi:hypothetical protein
VRTMGGAPAHHDAHGLSQGAQAYAAQTPYLFGEAVRTFFAVEWPLAWSPLVWHEACTSIYSLFTPMYTLAYSLSAHTLTHPSHTFFFQPLAHGVRGREPWERPFYFTLVGTIVCFLVASQYYRPTTHEWARDEAEERLRRCVACSPTAFPCESPTTTPRA